MQALLGVTEGSMTPNDAQLLTMLSCAVDLVEGLAVPAPLKAIRAFEK